MTEIAQMTSLVNKYKFSDDSLCGLGTYGSVFKTFDENRKEYVAIKEVKLDSSAYKSTNQTKLGFPQPCLREISLLKSFLHQNTHPNIVTLHEILCGNDIFGNSPLNAAFYMVFEYLEFDLRALISQKYKFDAEEIKLLFGQLMEALNFLHENRIIHRDIKAANILLTREYQLRLTDFGLARRISGSTRTLTNNVVTIWYKAPELLLGSTKYNYGVDNWAATCLLFEMLTSNILFVGKDVDEMLKRMFKICGTPSASKPIEKKEKDSANEEKAAEDGEDLTKTDQDADDDESIDSFQINDDANTKLSVRDWKSCKGLPNFRLIKSLKVDVYQSRLRKTLREQIVFGPDAKTSADTSSEKSSLLDFFEGAFRLDPNTRYTASQMLDSKFLENRRLMNEVKESGEVLRLNHDELHELKAKELKDKRKQTEEDLKALEVDDFQTRKHKSLPESQTQESLVTPKNSTSQQTSFESPELPRNIQSAPRNQHTFGQSTNREPKIFQKHGEQDRGSETGRRSRSRGSQRSYNSGQRSKDERHFHDRRGPQTHSYQRAQPYHANQGPKPQFGHGQKQPSEYSDRDSRLVGQHDSRDQNNHYHENKRDFHRGNSRQSQRSNSYHGNDHGPNSFDGPKQFRGNHPSADRFHNRGPDRHHDNGPGRHPRNDNRYNQNDDRAGSFRGNNNHQMDYRSPPRTEPRRQNNQNFGHNGNFNDNRQQHDNHHQQQQQHHTPQSFQRKRRDSFHDQDQGSFPDNNRSQHSFDRNDRSTALNGGFPIRNNHPHSRDKNQNQGRPNFNQRGPPIPLPMPNHNHPRRDNRNFKDRGNWRQNDHYDQSHDAKRQRSNPRSEDRRYQN